MINILGKLKGMNKKLLIYIITATVIVISGIIILMILKATMFGKISVEQLDDRLVVAAKNYFYDKKDRLPANDKDVETVAISELISSGYLKSLNKLLKDSSLTCSGEVNVTNNGGYYLYSPNINCGEKYKTQKLYEVITDVKNIVTEKDGLYKIGDDYVYRGEYVNNYVKFDNQLWRILRVNGSDNSIRIIQVDKTEDSYVWDNRYNSTEEDYIGINNYDLSRIKNTIKNFWENDKIITKDKKAYISTQPICIGPRKISDVDKTNKIDCSNINGIASLSLPLPSDYLIVSLDKSCKYVYNNECTNYNYLSKLDGTSWTTVTDVSTNYKAYILGKKITLQDTDSDEYLRFVINLSSQVNFSNGDGTYKNPYIIKYD